jgi:hydroxymethylpyrimidine pyrophosphatase-like HAD family hydrolase
VFATDWDRTLTRPDSAPDSFVRDALARIRRAGLRVVVVSGREYDSFRARVLALEEVDGLVAEDGAVVDSLDASPPLLFGAPTAARVREALGGAPIAAAFGRVVVSVRRDDEERLRALVRGLPVHLMPNVTQVMVLPEGIDKAAGVRALLARWGFADDAYVAVGDGENDAVMLRAARVSAAVGNATPPARAAARIRLRGEMGAGVVEFVDALLSGEWRAQEARDSV